MIIEGDEEDFISHYVQIKRESGAIEQDADIASYPTTFR